jgi:orotate phosphoribosyltransferase
MIMAASSTDLVDARYALSVAECLVACGAFTVDFSMPRERWFRWKSGVIVPFGCDCRRLNAFPAQRRLVDSALASAIAGAFPAAGYVVGVAHGGIPWAKAVADRLGLPLAYVRAQPRAAGGLQVEGVPQGDFRPGTRAVVVDDVVASGGSVAQAIRAIQAETGWLVAGIQSIANWGFPEMRESLGQWPVRALTSYPQVIDRARAAGLIDDGQASQLRHFYLDPRSHTWGQ